MRDPLNEAKMIGRRLSLGRGDGYYLGREYFWGRGYGAILGAAVMSQPGFSSLELGISHRHTATRGQFCRDA
jgi:hypothetical protein